MRREKPCGIWLVAPAHTEVRVAALRALSQLDPVEITAGFAKSTFEVGYSWNTMGAALFLWQRADPEAGWEAIQKAVEIPEAQGPFAPTLVAASAGVPAEQRVPWLLSLAGEANGASRLQVEALLALGDHTEDPQVQARLIAALQSPYLGHQGRRGAQLVSASDPGSARGLDRLLSHLLGFPSETSHQRAIQTAPAAAPGQ